MLRTGSITERTLHCQRQTQSFGQAHALLSIFKKRLTNFEQLNHPEQVQIYRGSPIVGNKFVHKEYFQSSKAGSVTESALNHRRQARASEGTMTFNFAPWHVVEGSQMTS